MAKDRHPTSLCHLPRHLQLLTLTLLLPYVSAQSRPLLPLNQLLSFNSTNTPTSPVFAVPARQDGPLALSVALCSSPASSSSSSSTPRFFLSNTSNWDTQPDPSAAATDTQIVLNFGVGSWSGLFPEGGVLAVDGLGEGWDFELAVSDSDPIHALLPSPPLLGDTTANQAILFSAPFLQLTPAEKEAMRPRYPNYTLPAANMTQRAVPAGGRVPRQTLLLGVTGEAGVGAGEGGVMLRSGCALIRSALSSSSSSATTASSTASTTTTISIPSPLPSTLGQGTLSSATIWDRDDGEGWRTQWVMEGLEPTKNYTAYVLTDDSKVSGPIYLKMKTAAFTCPLIHSLPYCPSISYAIPLPPPPLPSSTTSSSTTYTDASNLIPPALTAPLLSYLANFTTALTTHACGRDWYSPLVGCDDCQRAYRAWVCAVVFVRCAEGDVVDGDGNMNTNMNPSQLNPPAPALIRSTSPLLAASLRASPLLQSPLSPSSQQSPQQQQQPKEYTALLPCIESCHAVARACPPFLGFKCPSSAGFGAERSYGVGYVDAVGEGERGRGRGRTGRGADGWGNFWCGI